MGKMREHKLFCLSAVVLLFAVVVVFYTAIMGKYQKTTFMNSYSVKTFDEWVLEREDGTVEKIQAFPYKADVSRGDVYTLTTVLPDDITDESGIMIYINYSGTEVYVDGEKIDEYGMKQPLPFGRMIGNIRYITALNADMAGKKLTYKITCYYNGAGTLNPITYGNMDGLKLSVIYHNLWRLVISVIIFTLALICLGFFFFHERKKEVEYNTAFYHLGAFLVYIVLWLISSSDIPQFFINANETVSLVSFLSLSIMGIHFAAYTRIILQEGEKWFRFLSYIGWIDPLIILTGFVANLWDPAEVLILNHLYIGMVAVSAFVFVIKKKEKELAEHLFITGVLTIIVAAAISLVAYYYNPSGGIDAIFLGVGVTVFAVLLFLMILCKEVKFIEERRMMDIYRELAFKDNLTGLGNRAAYDRKMEEIRDNGNEDMLVQLLMLDVNGLKHINDNLGHYAGDKIILGAAQCIRDAFGTHGQCYRIGGDEYAVIYLAQPGQMEKDIAKLEEVMAEYNEGRAEELRLSLAYGYEEQMWSGEEYFLRKMTRFADEKMYEDKRRKHGCRENDN